MHIDNALLVRARLSEPGFKHLARISNYTMLFIIERNISIFLTQPCILQVSHTIGKKDQGSLVCIVHNGYFFALI